MGKFSKEFLASLTPTYNMINLPKDKLVGAVITVGTVVENEDISPDFSVAENEDNRRVKYNLTIAKGNASTSATAGVLGLLYMGVKVAGTKEPIPLFKTMSQGADGETGVDIPKTLNIATVTSRKNKAGKVMYPAHMYKKFQDAVDVLTEEAKGGDIEIITVYQDRKLMQELAGEGLTKQWLDTKAVDSKFEDNYAQKTITVTL